MSLMSQVNPQSGIFYGIRKNSHKNTDFNYQTLRDRSLQKIESNRDTIYIKRHLLKTRGITSFTRFLNQEAETAINFIEEIETQK